MGPGSPGIATLFAELRGVNGGKVNEYDQVATTGQGKFGSSSSRRRFLERHTMGRRQLPYRCDHRLDIERGQRREVDPGLGGDGVVGGVVARESRRDVEVLAGE